MANILRFPAPQATATATGLSLVDQLRACRSRMEPLCRGLPAPYPAFTLIFSISDGSSRAQVQHVSAPDFETAWQEGAEEMLALAKRDRMLSPWLRVDWVEAASPMLWGDFETLLGTFKRNYFRLGLALDGDFRRLVTEQEINGNAMLYGNPQVPQATFNRNNFEIYLRRRCAHEPTADFDADRTVYLLTTRGVFCQNDGVVHTIVGSGPQAGHRQLPALTLSSTAEIVNNAVRFLAGQIQPSGQFVHGHFPCFDRRVASYSGMRHASALYGMLEAWQVSRCPALMADIDRAMDYLCRELVHEYALLDGSRAAFVVEPGQEIKLGGNALALLALVRHAELTRRLDRLPIMEHLANGMAYMQHHDTGLFHPLLDARDLSRRQPSRITAYDSEAAYALMRLFSLTRQTRWLNMVERCVSGLISTSQPQVHDHWLSCAINELTRWRPEEKYFLLGLQNVQGYLELVLERQTTSPNRLELMLATHQMLRRLSTLPSLRHLLKEVNFIKFQKAMDHRANHLLNGYFWPEMAMYFAKPEAVVGSFFTRHHSFRVRIDDVESYLSGLAGYHAVLEAREASRAAALAASSMAPVRTVERQQDEELRAELWMLNVPAAAPASAVAHMGSR